MPGIGDEADTQAQAMTGFRLALALAWASILPSSLYAATLADRLSRLITNNSYLFQGANFDSLTPALERIAVLGTDVPATSTIPGVTYTFDFEATAPVRTAGSLGPVFLERAETVGRRRFVLGASYLFAELSNLDGRDANSELFFFNDALGVDTETQHTVRVQNRFTFDEFAIRLHAASLSATFGLSERWDLNLLVPLLHTELDVRATTQNFTRDLSDGSVIADAPRRLSLRDDAFGVGDVLLRTKYHVGRVGSVDAAAGFTLRTPTGREDDFHGIGDWTLTPILVLSRGIGHHDLHANLGVEANADDPERSRARYGIGATVQPIEQLALLLDVIGSSGVADDEFSQEGRALTGSRFDGPFQTGTATAQGPGVLSRVHFTSVIPRADVLDLALGVKVSPGGRFTAFVTAIVPLTPDGLRADVIPAGGVEYTF